MDEHAAERDLRARHGVARLPRVRRSPPAARAASSCGAVASLREPRTTMGGVNLVAGFRPELWRDVVRRTTRPPTSTGSTPTSSGPTASRCPRRSTTPCSGCRAARTTSSSTPPARRSRRSRGLAVGRGGDVELAVPARPRPDRLHRRHARTRRWSRRPSSSLVPDGRAGRRRHASCCCRSGRTTRPRGSRWRSPSRSA